MYSCNSQDNSGKITMDTEKDSISYALGVNFGSNIQENFKDINPQVIAKAIEDVYEGKDLKITEEDATPILRNYFMKAQKAEGDKNLQESKEFMAKNAEEKDVQKTESGLQYKIIEEGTGASPAETDQVKVHYKGTLIDGTVFDSSYERNQPATFKVNAVIPGWTEGLQMMKEGGKWIFYIPPELGYGERAPRGSKIGPNSALIFEVELLEVLPQEQKQ